MSVFVLDASVAVKWYVSEVHSEHAKAVLASEHDLIAPGFVLNEVSNAFLKKIRSGEMRLDIALGALPHIRNRVSRVDVAGLEEVALEFALLHERSLFDSFYVVLAVERSCRLITADERLYNGLQDKFRDHLLWIGDFPASADEGLI